HNNRAERELRPPVIARKTSLGSQSDAGAKTREIIMTLVHTLAQLRHGNSYSNFFRGVLIAKSLVFNERVQERACSVNLPS
ncbi:MAG: transposase, partial [Terriglobia bacterium]